MVQLTSKQRAYLKGLAMKEEAILQLGKTGVTPEFTASLDEALAARELVKIGVQRTFAEEEDLREAAETLAERTNSCVVQTIGRKIVFYRPGDEKHRRIELPRARKTSGAF